MLHLASTKMEKEVKTMRKVNKIIALIIIVAITFPLNFCYAINTTNSDVQLNKLKFENESLEVNLADLVNNSITVPTTIEFTGNVGYIELSFSKESGDDAYTALIYNPENGKTDFSISKSKTDLYGMTWNLITGETYTLTKIFFYDKDGKFIKRYVTPYFGHEGLGENTIDCNFSFKVMPETESVKYSLIDGDITNDETLTEANVDFASILRTNLYGWNSNVGVLPPHSRIKIDYNNEMFDGLDIDKTKTSIERYN